MIIEISIAVVAIAFVALVIYLITMIKALRITLAQVNHTLVEARKQLGEVGGQAQKIMEHTNQLSFDIKHKVEAFNPIFHAVANAGEILEYKTSSLKKDFLTDFHKEKKTSGLNSEEKKKIFQTQGLTTVAVVLELMSMGMHLWQKFKQRR